MINANGRPGNVLTGSMPLLWAFLRIKY